MSQIPEEMLQQIMSMLGVSRKEAEKMLTKSLHEMANGPVFKEQTPRGKALRGAKPKYSRTEYPHFLPADHVQKYTMRVVLKGTSPSVWRKFECPSNISLRHLTELVMQLMGWMDEHLNQIVCKHETYYVPCYQHDPDSEWGDTYFQEEHTIADVLMEKGKTVGWEYDFGDSWQHDIRLSVIDEYKDGEPHDIVFKSGKGTCPPEDCGGIWGYQELLELNEKRKSHKRLTSEERERLDWYDIDKDYDPEFCDEDECIEVCADFSDEEMEIKPTAKEVRLTNKNMQDVVKKELAKLPPIYDDVLSLAFRIRELEPWADIADSDVYAIRMDDGEEAYIATMGNGGASPEVQIYYGPEEFSFYLKMLTGDTVPTFELMNAAYWAQYRSVLFQEPDDMMMQPIQYDMIEEWAKVHGVEIEDENGYPFPQFIYSHHYPTMNSADEDLPRFKAVLEAVTWFSQQVLDVEDLTDLGFDEYSAYPTTKGGKVVPLIVKTSDGYRVERTKLPGLTTNYETMKLSDSELKSLKYIDKVGTQFCRLIHIPGGVDSDDEDNSPYIPLMFVCVDKKTGEPSYTDVCELTDTIERDVMRQYIKKVQGEGALPQRIITDDPRTEVFLRQLCKKFGVILELRRTPIPELTYFCELVYEKPTDE